jgi:CRISPR/Cas system-associated exonuclease Cas4 (RecB family)
MQALDGSGTTPIQGMPALVEPNVDGVPLGAINNRANGADPSGRRRCLTSAS